MQSEPTSKRMQGKRVLVTGAGTGIGKGVALEFAREGADVVIHYSHSAPGALDAVEQIKPLGVRVAAIHADMSLVEDCRRLGREALDFLGGLDVLVNNAGITVNTPFEKVTPEQWDKMYFVNVRGQFFLTQSVLAALEASRGTVLNFSSLHGLFGKTQHSVYAGTKGAIIAQTRELALELAPKGIRVNGIIPGWVRVENQEQALGEDFDWEGTAQTIPAGSISTPREMGRLALFLASEEGRYFVGQNLIYDGGYAAIFPNTGDWRDGGTIQFGSQYL